MALSKDYIVLYNMNKVVGNSKLLQYIMQLHLADR